jgi:hypothetical protein
MRGDLWKAQVASLNSAQLTLMGSIEICQERGGVVGNNLGIPWILHH